jgi:hypothetical protein
MNMCVKRNYFLHRRLSECAPCWRIYVRLSSISIAWKAPFLYVAYVPMIGFQVVADADDRLAGDIQ